MLEKKVRVAKLFLKKMSSPWKFAGRHSGELCASLTVVDRATKMDQFSSHIPQKKKKLLPNREPDCSIFEEG